nr:PREDICTED: uncharacterized protein LOC108210701 [Daucus carota subsp. sativus]
MDNPHPEQHLIPLPMKRKRGRPRKEEAMKNSNTSTPVSLGQKRPIGRPRKNVDVKTSSTTFELKEDVLVSNSTSQLMSTPQKRPVGRPRKVHTNSISASETIIRGQARPLIVKTATPCHLRPLLPRLPSFSCNNVTNVAASSQLTNRIVHSSSNSKNDMRPPSSNHIKNKPGLTLSIDDLNDSESYELDEGYIIDSDNDENYNSGEEAAHNDTMTILAHQGVKSQYLNLDMPKYKCKFCQAIMWIEERNNKSMTDPTFSICCAGGQIQLPEVKKPPPYLAGLLFGQSKKFRDSIKVYNAMFCYTSLGGKVDNLINKNGGGPFCFRLSCQNHHSIGSLVPLDGRKPQFCQLYFYDTENEVHNRMFAFRSKDDKKGIQREIVENLIKMFDEVSPLAQKFRQARDRFKEQQPQDLKIIFKESRSASGRPNHIYPSSEIAALIVAENDPSGGDRDVVVHTKTSGPKRISFIHPLFMALQYPILFPYAENGFHKGIKYKTIDSNTKKKRKNVTLKEYHSYQLHIRPNEGMTLRYGGRLFQQYIVDAFSVIEQTRLHWYRTHQSTVRADMYQNIRDQVRKGDENPNSCGKSFILPASFTGSKRYMNQNFLDALAICRAIGHPDIFLTMTANSKWPEIQQMLNHTPGLTADDAPDIVTRVFKLKLDQLLHLIKKKGFFGRCIGALHVIEFQKRGLPHAHMVIWLHPDNKPKTIQQVDAMVSAEIPDKDQDRDGYNAVKQFMIHGPCGTINNTSPCMDTERKVCTRHFPKRYASETTFDDSGFPVYRRRKTNHTVQKNNVDLDNQWVVPYNRELLLMFQCHINVEICNHSRSLKYLFKYCMKGHDRATMLLVRAKNTVHESTRQSDTTKVAPINEIKQYLDGRYVCASEAIWRIYGFHIHLRSPSVERLPIHLEDMQTITFNSNELLTNVAKRASFRLSKLQAWFQANREYPWARDLYYQEFPGSFVWDANSTRWTPRKQGFVVGRMNSTYASSGDLFYLRMILTRVKGAMSFRDLRTVNGQVYKTFKDTCNALGLLENDMEWHEAIKENAHHATASQLRQLFVHIIVNCEVSNPAKLWNDHIKDFSDDILWKRRHISKNNELTLSEEEIQFWALSELEQILNCIGKSLRSYSDMPFPPAEFLCGISNTLIAEERSYDIQTMIAEHQQLHSTLNRDQTVVYNSIIESVHNKSGKFFFVHGSGGCGKTFLWRTIISKLRSERKIVLPVASSGIAAVLMPGGRTAHSRFKIPLDVDEHSSCGVKMGTDIAELLQNTDLIIWDEAPMQKKYAFEALDRALRDIRGNISEDNRLKSFGGITVVLAGDFRQILPVVEKGNRHDIVSACVNRSYLWDQVTFYTLKQNMRLKRGNTEQLNNDIDEFSKWVLDIGEGRLSFISDDDPNKDPEVVIPQKFVIPCTNNPLSDIVDIVYPNIECNFKDHRYLRDRAILAPTNKVVDELNENIMDRIPGEEQVYLSVNSIDEGPVNETELNSAFPEEFLNSIDMSGLPKHKLKLKPGVVVMLTRNINQAFGLCNGTRMVVKKMFKWTVECEIITGSHSGSRHIIPRMITTPCDNNSKWPFIFKRKQFPLQVCFAMTINKSQGQSMEKVGLYLPNPIFCHGQLYVAISRVTSPEGLHIMLGDGINYTKNIVYEEVFYNLPTE